MSRTLVAELLNHAGYSLQGNRKTKEGDSHPDREPLCGIDQSPFPRDGYRVAGGEAAGINGLRRHPTSSVPRTGGWLKSTRRLRNCQFIIAKIAR